MKKRSISSVLNPILFFSLMSFAHLSAAQFANNPLNIALDNSTVEIITADDADFFAQTNVTNFDGDAVQSGDIGNGEVSTLATFVNGGDRVSFDWRVSSEAGFDELVFIVADVNLNLVAAPVAIDGEVNWRTRSLTIPGSGPRILVWGYVKDGSVSSGSDAGWVDNLRVNTSGGEISNPIDEAPVLSPIINLLLDDTNADQSDPVNPPVELDPTIITPAIPNSFDGKYYLAIQTIPDDSNQVQRDYIYTQVNSNSAIGSGFSESIDIRVDGAGLVGGPLDTEDWNWQMSLPRQGQNQGRLTPGLYDNATRFPFNDTTNGLSFSGLGRGCNTLSGSFRIFEIEYTGDEITRLLADFEQRCTGSNRREVGSIDFNASRADAVFPTREIPQGTPSPTLPELQSNGGILIVEGTDTTFIVGSEGLSLDNTNSSFTTSRSGASNTGITVTIQLNSGSQYSLDLTRPSFEIDPEREQPLSIGTYLMATRAPFNRPLAGLDFSGNGRGCGSLRGSFRIFDIEFDTDGELSKLLADFQQFCGSNTESINGSIHLDFTLAN